LETLPTPRELDRLAVIFPFDPGKAIAADATINLCTVTGADWRDIRFEFGKPAAVFASRCWNF
jgi:hypothetical protein